MTSLRPFWAILRVQTLAKLQYRAAMWAQFGTTIFFGFVQIVIIGVFYRYGQRSAATSGLSWAQAVSYTWLVQVFLHLLPGLGADAEVRNKIRSGDIGYELCRPLDLYWHWFARSLALRLGPFLLYLVPVAAVALLLPAPYRLQPPASLLGLLACLLTLGLGLVLSCATIGLIYVWLMRVDWGNGPIFVMTAVTDLLSGANLPLQLWPAGLQRFLLWQPFAGIMDLPLRLYLGTLPASDVWLVAARQLAWAAALVVGGSALMRRNLRRLVVQGG